MRTYEDLVKQALYNTKDPNGVHLPKELISNARCDQLVLDTTNPIVYKNFLPKGYIAENCGQFATVCRVSDTMPLLAKYATHSIIGASPVKYDGRQWVTYLYAPNKKGKIVQVRHPIAHQCCPLVGARAVEEDDQALEGCEHWVWQKDTDNRYPTEDKGGYVLMCGLCDVSHMQKDVDAAGYESLHRQFNPNVHDWKSPREYMTDLKWIYTRSLHQRV